mmetsp:Transcript_4473/g.6671  ORF Transcript_4473/g.6671 Transcript_4473/m.6671 type:complete len:275 (+) Transcript_4473:1526-2350(+)
MEETVLKSGSLEIQGSVAYVEQEPFIISGSIRENIVMGLTYGELRFQKAIEAACLSADMAGFKKGAETVIGERGINISGGQKARISLARAIYSDADIYLLDDPLSAVDPKVANEIFHNCLRGALADKIVVLVTHQLQFLRETPKILVLAEGQQKVLGTFEEISNAGFNIDDILNSYGKVEERESEKFEAEDKAEKKSETKDSSAEQTKEGSGDLIEKEKDDEEKVSIQDLFTYFKYGSGVFGIITILVVCSLNTAWLMAVLYWISLWSQQDAEE